MSNHDQALGTWPNAPLALVVAQVRFDPEVDTEYKKVAERLKAQLGEQFPAMKAVRQMTFVFGGAPDQAFESKPNEGEIGRELRRDDNRGALRLQDGVMTYTTSIYKNSKNFLSEWRSMLDCLCADAGIKVQRLGLRYLDFIIPTGDKVPEDYFKDGFGHLPHADGGTAQWGVAYPVWTRLCATFTATGFRWFRSTSSRLAGEIHRRQAIGGSRHRPLAN